MSAGAAELELNLARSGRSCCRQFACRRTFPYKRTHRRDGQARATVAGRCEKSYWRNIRSCRRRRGREMSAAGREMSRGGEGRHWGLGSAGWNRDGGNGPDVGSHPEAGRSYNNVRA